MVVEALIQDKAHYQRILEAAAHQSAGRLHEAEQIYLELLEENPDDANVLHLLGILAHQAGFSQQGIRLIERAESLLPSSPLFMNNLGHIYLHNNQLDQAEQLFNRATQTDPDMAAPLYGLGECSRRRGKLQEAADYIELVLDREPANIDAVVCLGKIHYDNRSFKKAIELFDIALNIDPEHFEARFQQARTHFSMRAYEKSLTILRELLEHYPGHAAVHNNIGNAYMAQEQYQQAQQAYQAAVEINSEDVGMRYNLALALVKLNEPGEAIRHLETGLKKAPENSSLQKLLLHAQWVQGYTEQGL